MLFWSLQETQRTSSEKPSQGTPRLRHLEHEGRSRSQRAWRRLQVWQLPRKCDRVAGMVEFEMHGWENEEEDETVESGVCFTCIHLALLGSAISMNGNHIFLYYLWGCRLLFLLYECC